MRNNNTTNIHSRSHAILDIGESVGDDNIECIKTCGIKVANWVVVVGIVATLPILLAGDVNLSTGVTRSPRSPWSFGSHTQCYIPK